MPMAAVDRLAGNAEERLRQLRAEPLGFIAQSAQAGILIGVAIALLIEMLVVATPAGTRPGWGQLLIAVAVAFPLVLWAGADLFTGHVLSASVAAFERRVCWRDAVRLWAVSYAANLVGALLAAAMLAGTGLFAQGRARETLLSLVEQKASLSFAEAFFRGALCAFLVALAGWMGLRVEFRLGRPVLLFWAVYAFFAAGYDMGVADAALAGMAALAPPSGLPWYVLWQHLLPVTLGNLGGASVLVAGGLWLSRSVAQPGTRIAGVSDNAARLGEVR